MFHTGRMKRTTHSLVEESNVRPALWCLSAWAKGATGVLPWQSIGGEKSWEQAEQTALFYPGQEGPQPSARLKAFTRGQQEVEYLTLLCNVLGVPRFAILEWMKRLLPIDAEWQQPLESERGALEPGLSDTVNLWKMRYTVGKAISERSPAYKRSLVDFSSPIWNPEALPCGG
jgi:hypothetical protein